MKKFKLLAVALVIGTASLFATNGATPDEPNKEIRNQIVQLLDTPDFIVNEDMSVVLKFTFNSEGEIVVLCPGCKDKKVVDYIRENLNNKIYQNNQLTTSYTLSNIGNYISPLWIGDGWALKN